MKTLISIAMMALTLLPSAAAQECQDFAAPRLTVVISDLHLGQGKTGESWSPYDDFRWSKALAGLLGYVGTRSQDQADLVVAGDLFELWQHPGVACAGGGKDFGCTVGDMEAIVQRVVQVHAPDLEELGRFASRGRNRVIVVPGNHDAALMLDDIWKIVHPAFKATAGRVCRAVSGTWASPDGAVVVEHGHQIGIDVNKFPRWPEVAAVTAQDGGQTRMVKTWGESFVQELYNETEDDYPLIDNVQPMTSALADYLRNEGLLKAVPRDLARFISFNLFDTSWRQKLTLGGPGAKQEAPSWNVTKARQRGWRLFSDALPDGDPTREGLRAEPPAAEWQAVRAELDAMANDASALPPEEVEYLCDQMKIQAAVSKDTGRLTCDTELGGALFQRIVPENRRMARYLDKLREKDHAAMKIYIYGHTHSLRSCWDVKMSNGHRLPVFNTGAFHRLVDKDMFEALAASQTPKMTPKEALKSLPLDKLPACYPMVVVDSSNGVPKGKLWNWYMEEDAASGQPIPACDPRCALINESLCSTKKGGLCAGMTE